MGLEKTFNSTCQGVYAHLGKANLFVNTQKLFLTLLFHLTFFLPLLDQLGIVKARFALSQVLILKYLSVLAAWTMDILLSIIGYGSNSENTYYTTYHSTSHQGGVLYK
jgi:hypothetical protein